MAPWRSRPSDLQAVEVDALIGRDLGDHHQRGDGVALIPEGARAALGLQRQAAVGPHVGERVAVGVDAGLEPAVVADQRTPGHVDAAAQIVVVVAPRDRVRRRPQPRADQAVQPTFDPRPRCAAEARDRP